MFFWIFVIFLFISLASAQENSEDKSVFSRLNTSVTLDNSGTAETERLRANALVWLDSLFQADDGAHFGYYTAPTKPLDLSVAYGGYRITWGDRRNTAELSGYISNQKFTTRSLLTDDPFSGISNGYSIQGKVTRNLATHKSNFGTLSHSVDASLEFQQLKNIFNDLGVSSGDRVRAMPASVAYEISVDGRDQVGHGFSSFLLARYIANLNIANLSDAEAFSRNRIGAKTDFDFFRFAGDVRHVFDNNWMFLIEFFAQYSDEPLIPGFAVSRQTR